MISAYLRSIPAIARLEPASPCDFRAGVLGGVQNSGAFGREKADAALADRLARLELPLIAPGLGAPTDRDAWSGTFAPEGGNCPAQPTLTAITLTPESGPEAGGAPGWLPFRSPTASGPCTGVRLHSVLTRS